MNRKNMIFRTAYGTKRLAKVSKELEEKLKRRARRSEKNYPGETLHGYTERLPLLKGQSSSDAHEYIFIAIDEYTRELYARTFPEKTQYSTAQFLTQVLDECPYTIEQWYTNKGREWGYKGNSDHHAFMKLCHEHCIKQRFTKAKTQRKNGEAEQAIKTIIAIWSDKMSFKSRLHRKQELIRFINWYNTMKPHKGVGSLTPMEKLFLYFYSKKL